MMVRIMMGLDEKSKDYQLDYNSASVSMPDTKFQSLDVKSW